MWNRKSVFVVLSICIIQTNSIQWLGMQKAAGKVNWEDVGVCRTLRKTYGLDSRQARICKSWRPVMQHVSRAAALAVVACQTVLQNRRWNCSSVRDAPRLTPELAKGTKEQSFVYALSSAALTYTMTRDCASGMLPSCGCGTHPDDTDGTFKWSGCDDNVRWGAKFARQFVKSENRPPRSAAVKRLAAAAGDGEYGGDVIDMPANVNDEAVLSEQRAMAIVDEHNYRIGRKIVMSSMKTHCKCHGMSGSCNVKTCWRGLPNKFITVGVKLLKLYNKSPESPVKVGMVQVIQSGIPKHTENSLVYITESSDYCNYDPRVGSYGTVGRKCNTTIIGNENCLTMCCGRGYTTQIIEQTERCQCKYHWCCYVNCQNCTSLVKRQICN
ncbi:Wnt,Wnt protein, conserved site [Cinara cedri]|uniref:Protein Wnt n=1 Tax=Cinara cedri TaxID=506608 RepID=A0A5E4LYE3_9HEMI|nr:Wnt,Wnt protein, conserved site [Cinara cedri]